MNDAAATPDRGTRAAVLASVGALGFSSVATQLSLLRELLGAFSGNELVLGVCLGNWFILMAAGAWLGEAACRLREPRRAFAAGQLAAAVIPLGQVAAVRVLRDVAFVRGASVGLASTWLGSLVLLAPYCLVAGALLTLGCRAAAAEPNRGALGPVYLADTAGSVAGGFAFVFVLVPRFDHFALLCAPAFLNLALAAHLCWRIRSRWILAAASCAGASLAALLVLADPDAATTAIQHRGERIVFRTNSPYGRLIACESSGLLTFYENGIPMAATENAAQVEEAVHYAMCQRPRARQVLLIGGGVAGDALEVLRYGAVRRVTYVELDPAIIGAGQRLAPRNLADPRIAVRADDGRRFARRAVEAYDVVIVDLPDPSTSELNRYYTAQFFAEAHRALAPGGVLAFGLGHYENFVGPELARMLSSAHRTLAGVFRNVLMIPGGRVYFLASDGPLNQDISGLIESAGVRTRIVNRHYLAAVLAPDRMADLERTVAMPAAANTDQSPVLYYYETRRWMSQFGRLNAALGAALALALAAYLVRIGTGQRVIFAAGFAASGIEIVLLIGYQVLYGSVYRQVGLVVTVFMAGLAAGAWAGRPLAPEPRAAAALPLLGVAVAALAALTPLVLRASGAADTLLGSTLAGQGLILAATFALAALVGAQFPIAAALPGQGRSAAARIFSADLAGGAVGALLVSSLLIPLLGIPAVCLLTAGLNGAAAALAWAKRP